MCGVVKPRRRYFSPQREQQAQATRQQIVGAAARLFEQDGYFGATIEAIAQDAGVAAPTVYAAFGTKRAILSALVDAAIFGNDPPGTPSTERTWYRELANEPDTERLLRRWGAYLCQVNVRVAPVQRVVQSAAASDPEVAKLWLRMKEQRFAGQGAAAHLLFERHALRPDLSERQAADTLFVLSDAHIFDAYVVDRGWSPEEVAHWLGDTLCALLLPLRD
jgi:TetR/AcrR family transcriptional regulator, regulator of autoinduction and epiphytic fitness